jgi:hypothetical protein
MNSSSSYRHLARFSSPGNLPKKGAVVRDRLANLFERLSEFNTEVNGRVSGHLAYVESLLRMRSTRHLSETQRANRELLLDLLVVYASGRSYPQGLFQKGEDRPCYVDDEGVFCPVGFLLARTAGQQFAQAVCAAKSAEDLPQATRDRLEQWISYSGFSDEELSLLQPRFPAIMMDHYKANAADFTGVHPLFEGLQRDSQNREGDYFAKAFIGSEALQLPQEGDEAQAAEPGAAVLASVFGQPAEDAPEGTPRMRAFYLPGGTEPVIALTFSRSF